MSTPATGPGEVPPAPGGDSPAQTGENTCPRCGGTGRTDDATCPTCDGRGTVVELVGDA